MTKVAVIVGSLRKGSFNRQLAEALTKLAAPRLELEIVEIGDLPLYNQDDEGELPAPVARFKGQIEAADAVLFVTPEFNRSFSAAIKNAIEWGSRPWGKNSWMGKPGAIVGATPGAVGTAAGQSQLRNVAQAIGIALMVHPEIYLSYRESQFSGPNVTDDGLAQLLNGWVDSFADWIKRLS